MVMRVFTVMGMAFVFVTVVGGRVIVLAFVRVLRVV